MKPCVRSGRALDNERHGGGRAASDVQSSHPSGSLDLIVTGRAAYLFGGITILQLHAQATGLGIPSQLMSSLPYLATILVLVAISWARGRRGSPAPASLGLAFVPDR